MATSQDFVNWTPTSAVRSDWLRIVFGADRTTLLRFARGSVHNTIYFSEWLSVHIALPPLAEQDRIIAEVDKRLSLAQKFQALVEANLARAAHLKNALLESAFAGRLMPEDPKDEPADALLTRLRDLAQKRSAEKTRATRVSSRVKQRVAMKRSSLSPDELLAAFENLDKRNDANKLFAMTGLGSANYLTFYEALRQSSIVRAAFTANVDAPGDAIDPLDETPPPPGHFRLVELWLHDFKNLKDYAVQFDPRHGLDVIMGWNGTGKSNLFEALVIILRDLHVWRERGRWPTEPMNGFRLRYEINGRLVEVSWDRLKMKRPTVTETPLSPLSDTLIPTPEVVQRANVLLPRFVFGYYSGPTNRLAEHFQPMNQAHYKRLREAPSDDPKVLAQLLEERRFFCAETHHAKYVLLAFCYREDPTISKFLEERLRITGFESALFIIKKPRWAKRGSTADDFWGATGVMRRVMERLRRFAVAPMMLEQTVYEGYRTRDEDHYYFFLPDSQRLHDFANEYRDARTFFLALESIDFSELIHDVKIQVRVQSSNTDQVPITFREMSEGEQQLLMVLGLMRFTKSHQSLVLLDEPDTHLNPHWSVGYLKMLTTVMGDDGDEPEEQQTSQILISTHDPLVIASLVKEQIHLLKRDWETGACKWVPASVNPRGLGFTGILTSEMFGFRSDLDEETLADLDNKVRLVARQGELNKDEVSELAQIDQRLEAAGFSKAFSDPYYSAFVRAWGRRYNSLMSHQQFLTPEQRKEIDRVATEVLEEAMKEIQAEEVSR